MMPYLLGLNLALNLGLVVLVIALARANRELRQIIHKLNPRRNGRQG